MSGDIDKVRMRPESLFSLEVVVEKLAVPSVVCRFPAVAFRLLDFPTLLVYHVEPDLAETIKRKISADPHYKVPPQLQELKDKSGYFVLKKGKSCLFKVSSEMLQAHLMNTPLYVMLIDTYPKVPKLIGNCSIPLDDVMARISNDINHHGISTPSSHGERGEFKVYNLMGFEVGDITLGFRLLSLGMGLIPHIPDNVVSVCRGDQPIAQPTPIKTPASRPPTAGFGEFDNMEDIVENIVQSIESADKNTQVAISEFIPHKEHINTQTEQEKSYFRSSGIQTDIQRKKKTRQRRKDTAGLDTFTDVGNEMSDFFVTNMACPPPLFYNSEADDIHVYQQSLQQGLTFNEDGLMGVQAPQPNYAWGEGQTELSSTCSEDTIRHEDVFSDSDVDEEVDFESKRVVYKESRKSVTRKTKIQARKLTDKHIAHKTSQVMQNMSQQGNVKLQQLPLLNALLKEIMALQGVSSLPIAAQTTTTTTTTSRSTSAQSKQTPRDRADREEHLKKLATPRTVAAKQAEAPGSPHKVCTDHPQPVPKNKSWVRKEADTALPVAKTKLTYGMTNAQRLRLAKANPALLKKLEKGDQERIEKSRERTRKKYLQYQQEIEIGDRLMHSARSVKSQKSLKLDTRASMESTNGHISEASKSHRRPVPTPRRSVSMKNELMKEALMKIMEKEYAHGTEAERSGEHEDRDQRHERRVKEIMALQDADDTHDELGTMPEEVEKIEPPNIPTLVDAVPSFGQTKTLYNPGFPSEVQSGRDSRATRPESQLSDYVQYSEDFEKSVNGNNDPSEVLSLRKIVERYSDDSESAKSDVLGDEPSLRKVVDQYSSDEDHGSFETVPSHDSNSNQSQSRYTGSHQTSATVMTLNIASMPNPRASIHSPVAAIRPQIPPTREGLAASSTPTESDLGTTQQSTAYIRESQMPTMSDTGGSFDPVGSIDEQRESVDLRPRPSPRRKLDRISSVHTESVSSYAPSDVGLESENSYTESFDEDSDSASEPAPVKQMSELQLAPEARMGYTWGYSA